MLSCRTDIFTWVYSLLFTIWCWFLQQALLKMAQCCFKCWQLPLAWFMQCISKADLIQHGVLWIAFTSVWHASAWCMFKCLHINGEFEYARCWSDPLVGIICLRKRWLFKSFPYSYQSSVLLPDITAITSLGCYLCKDQNETVKLLTSMYQEFFTAFLTGTRDNLLSDIVFIFPSRRSSLHHFRPGCLVHGSSEMSLLIVLV